MTVDFMQEATDSESEQSSAEPEAEDEEGESEEEWQDDAELGSAQAAAAPGAAAAAASSAVSAAAAAVPLRSQSHINADSRAFLERWIDANGITLTTRWTGERMGALESASLNEKPGGYTTEQQKQQIRIILAERAALLHGENACGAPDALVQE